MSPGLALPLGLFLAVYAAVAVLAVRRPLLARLAAREAMRRRGQSLLVVGGLMIGTAAITASLIGIDSSLDSAVASGYRAWGMTDLAVTAPDRAPFDPAAAEAIAADARLDGVVDGVQGGLELVGSASDLTRRQGESGVRIIGFDPATQRPFGAYVLLNGTRTFGDDLGERGVILSRGLADALKARPGDRLSVTVESAGGGTEELTVAGIARAVGPGAYGLRPAVFAPLATVQRMAGLPAINLVRVSAVGGLETGLEGAERALPLLREVVRDVGDAVPLRVQEVKKEEVRDQRESTQWTTSMLTGMSVLILAAGAALVVNLILMLAEERRPRHGVLRALGLTRRGLVVLSVLEGAIYSLAAAAIGAGIGIGAGRLVSERFGRAFAEFSGGLIDIRFEFSLHWDTVLAGFAGGAVLTLVTVAFAARRTSRMSIPAAIRDLPEPARERHRRWPRVVLLSGGAVLAAVGLAGGEPLGRLVGGLALILVGSALLRDRVSPRVQAGITGVAMAGWSAAMVNSISHETDPNVFFSVFTVAVMASVFGLSIVAAANLRLVETVSGFLGRLFRGLRTVLRPPLAYLARRPLRTGLSTGVFAVVLAIVTLLAVFLSVFRPRYERDAMGYDIRLTSTGSPSVALADSARDEIERRSDIPTLGYVGPFGSSFFKTETAFIPLFELPAELVDDPPVRLTSREQSFDTDEEVWEAVAGDEGFVVTGFGNVGEVITLEGPDGPVEFTVAGNAGILEGVVASAESLEPFSSAPLGVTVLIDTVDGADAQRVARAIERSLFSQGVDAVTTRELLDRDYRANRTFFSVVDVLMRMGLVVGILSLGILALRAVVERRHVIGVLRALGYKRRGVMVGLMAEAGVTASIGVVVGVAVGVVMGWIFFRQFAPGNEFGIDGPSIWGALALVYASVLLVSVGPAYRASRLPPAEAVRYTE